MKESITRDKTGKFITLAKLKEIEKFANIPEEIYSSEVGEIGATSLKILRCWIG